MSSLLWGEQCPRSLGSALGPYPQLQTPHHILSAVVQPCLPRLSHWATLCQVYSWSTKVFTFARVTWNIVSIWFMGLAQRPIWVTLLCRDVWQPETSALKGGMVKITEAKNHRGSQRGPLRTASLNLVQKSLIPPSSAPYKLSGSFLPWCADLWGGVEIKTRLENVTVRWPIKLWLRTTFPSWMPFWL